MEVIIKIAMTGVLISILTILLKGMQSQITPVLVTAGSVILFFTVLNMANNASQAIKNLFDSSELGSETIKAVIKIIGAAYVVEFSSSLCRDMGENSIASKIEAAETGVLSVASITRCCARAWLENRSMPAARIKNLFMM